MANENLPGLPDAWGVYVPDKNDPQYSELIEWFKEHCDHFTSHFFQMSSYFILGRKKTGGSYRLIGTAVSYFTNDFENQISIEEFMAALKGVTLEPKRSSFAKFMNKIESK